MPRWILPGALLGLGLALALAFPPSVTAQNPSCQPRRDDNVDIFDCEHNSPPQETVRCIGPVEIETTLPMGGRFDSHICQRVRMRVHCNGQTELLAVLEVLNCPNPNGAWAEWCLTQGLEALVRGNATQCAWRDYYGQEIRLEVQVPPHVLQAAPYPVGMVAREDPIAHRFHPTTRVRWLPPQPQIADSGWRLWSWGPNRGPGNAPFPCDKDEAWLLAHGVPQGTTCLRMVLATAPAFAGTLEAPRLAPATLWFPVHGWQQSIAPHPSLLLDPNQTVELSFPYASHPATGEAQDVHFGDRTLPAFRGFFHRWWPVGLKVEAQRVEDLLGQETHCQPVAPTDPNWNCWAQEDGKLQRGRWETRPVVKGKRWVTIQRIEGVLRLQEDPIRWRYPALHPARLIVEGPQGTHSFRWVDLQGIIALYFPLAVREGQGVVCSDPTCGGRTPGLP